MSCFSFDPRSAASPVREPDERLHRLMADECVREEQAAEADFIERRVDRFNVEAA